MKNSTKLEDFYKPVIVEDFKVNAIAVETIPSGEKGKYAQKLFISSLDDGFSQITRGLLSRLVKGRIENLLNGVLVIIKPDHKAYVYTKYPFGVKAILKRSKEKFQAVFQNDIADIVSVSFKDDLIDLDPKKEDKFIFLFRENWVFGLFFDLTGNLDEVHTLEEIGYYYRRLAYLGQYKFIENNYFFEQMINDGWFPFVSLLGEGNEIIQTYYQDGRKHPSTISELVDKFDEKRLEDITNKWWNNSLFKEKKIILQAGINSFLSNTNDGYINSIKTLATEIEGILRIVYHKKYGKKPSTKELKEYIAQRGKKKFSSYGSLGFPEQFLDYLNGYIFQAFDVEKRDIPESRHSVAHGVAEDEIYTKEYCVKLILTLDNIYFFLG